MQHVVSATQIKLANYSPRSNAPLMNSSTNAKSCGYAGPTNIILASKPPPLTRCPRSFGVIDASVGATLLLSLAKPAAIGE